MMQTPVGDAILLLEDQALIAMDVEQLLREAGFSNISTCFSCAAAEEWLREHKPAFAVIEARLADGSCDHIASVLAQQGSRFVVHSAVRDDLEMDTALSGRCSWIEKPCVPEDLVAVVRTCMPC